MDFSNGAGQQSKSDLIPNGTLVWAILEVRGLEGSQAGGEYLDVELTIDQGQPYQSRKIWEMIGNPLHSGNSDEYRQMGQMAIARILEAGRGAGPGNPQAYQLRDFPDLTGLRVPIKVGVKPARNGYDAKNRVAEWLTPNPASGSGHKDYVKLMAGQTNANGAPARQNQGAAPASGFGGPQVQHNAGGAPGASGGFGNGGATGGFGGGQTTTGFHQAAPLQGGQSETMKSHSEPTASGWLAQANGAR